MLKKVKSYIWWRGVLFGLACTAVSYFFLKEWYILFLVTVGVLVYLFIEIYRHQFKIYKELNEFVEAIRYKDFSRNLETDDNESSINLLRTGFNKINVLFKNASKERETQYQYLQNVLEMIDTGILCYENESGEVSWMNESLKSMLNLPYLKNVHAFAYRDQSLYQQIVLLKPGESSIGTVYAKDNAYKVLLSATAFITGGQKYHLIAFQNINEALDETESKAWQKLLSVLTHEIMNSIAPISSLADTIKNRIETIKEADLNGSLMDIETGIDTIKRRSEGLIRFAETYRNLNKISTPDKKEFYVRQLFEHLYTLMQPTSTSKNIEFSLILKDPDLVINADFGLAEQVMINLILNAFDAVKDKPNPQITLKSELTHKGKVIIKVADNGKGIDSDIIEDIFIPFFSTKKTGSGIGLTLCKQIMMLHNGNIQVQSTKNEGSVFLLHF